MLVPQLEMMELSIYTLKKLLREQNPENFEKLIEITSLELKTANTDFRADTIDTIVPKKKSLKTKEPSSEHIDTILEHEVTNGQLVFLPYTFVRDKDNKTLIGQSLIDIDTERNIVIDFKIKESGTSATSKSCNKVTSTGTVQWVNKFWGGRSKGSS
jgi:hypothetical protein